MGKVILLLAFLYLSTSCAFNNYMNLPPRDKAFYNLMFTTGKKPNDFAALPSQQDRDNFLKQEGYLEKWNSLPTPIQEAILNNKIVKDAPEFTLYMAAGKPLKQNEEISMTEGATKTLFYLRCADNAGANAGKFVPDGGTCAASVSQAMSSVLRPGGSQFGNDIHAEAINYIVTVKDEKIININIVQELPKKPY